MESKVIHIWTSQLQAGLEKSRFDALSAVMPVAVQKELYAFKYWQDAQASLAGKLLVQHALKELELPFSIKEIRFLHKDRPYLDASFDFNISHSGDFIVLALTIGNKTGIDIEKHRKLDMTLFRKYFSDEEWMQITLANDPISLFFKYWTIKESAIKCDGRGVEVLGKTKTLNEHRVLCDETALYYQSIDMDKEYACTVCSENKIAALIVKRDIKVW